MSAEKWVYTFAEVKEAETRMGSWDAVRGLLGGKGANLARMTSIGLPVPFGFSITTRACNEYMDTNDFPAGLWDEVLVALKEVEKVNGKTLGDSTKMPLLLSCRSGAKFSMPGMMDTVLNIGLNDQNLKVLSDATNERFAADAYRRLIQGFGSVVMGISDEAFEDPLKAYKKEKNYASDVEMLAADWLHLSNQFLVIFKKETGKDFPQEPLVQLEMAVRAVFGSWNSKRAFAYRNRTGIDHHLGTACNIQTMVFGNMGNESATGVAFTRNPATGEKSFYGDYLINAQGEDVVAGIRNCTPVNEMGKDFAECFAELEKVGETLEANFRNMQDIEFTIEQKKLYMLQTRDGKRTAAAQVRIAIDMVNEGLITKEEAVRRVSPTDVNLLLLPQLDPKGIETARTENRMIAKGVNASPGGAVGVCVFDATRAEALEKDGKDCILVRPFTKPEDVHGFFASKGILTAEGGATSHAAVVARQFGKPCIVGASTLDIDLDKREMKVGTAVVKEGEEIAINATTGEIFTGYIPTIEADFHGNKKLRTLLQWADEICSQETERGGIKTRGLMVWANADNGTDASRAVSFGANGIGLCRTEHMFFEKERLPIVQEMIMAKDNDENRQKALDRLLPFQRSDFEDIFRAMNGRPVIVRLLDPPLHEFLPDYKNLLTHVAEMHGAKLQGPEVLAEEELLAIVESLHESNPMMGLRGVRLQLMLPGIVSMQVRALIEAAINIKKEGVNVLPEIMIPLASHVNELNFVKPQCIEVVEAVFKEKDMEIPYKFGTMIETPRAALTAAEIAVNAEFFSFGTNDLTQMTFGISRDDAEREFLLQYVSRRILPANPFQTMDENGVGKLVSMATSDGRNTRPDISVGICGEHGGDPDTIALCHKYGLTYVSCSPFRVPAARLAAAHAFLQG